jgi:glycosyltransferase involved in cell wall biosynthesis
MADQTGKIGILYLSYDGLTDPLGQSQILPYLKALSLAGHRITVVTFEKPVAFKKQGGEIQDVCDAHNLVWHPLQYHKSPQVISTLYDLLQLRRVTGRLVKKKSFSIVHCRSYLTSLIGLWAKRKFGIRFIFDMRGFWADERVEGGLWNQKNPLYRWIYTFFKNQEKYFVLHADHIVSLTENARQEILSWNIGAPGITVIPTCVDFDLFNPARISEEERIALRTKLGIGLNDFILLYLGSWGTWYMTQQMLNFFSAIKKESPSAKFLIVSPDVIQLEGYVHKADVIVNTAARVKIPLYISLANASVFFILPTYSKKASSATKMGELLAMNTAIITNRGWGDIELLQQQIKFNLVSDIAQFEESARQLIETSKSVQNSRTYAEALLSLKRGVALYHQVYKECSG